MEKKKTEKVELKEKGIEKMSYSKCPRHPVKNSRVQLVESKLKKISRFD
jgi:hypothetical protein